MIPAIAVILPLTAFAYSPVASVQTSPAHCVRAICTRELRFAGVRREIRGIAVSPQRTHRSDVPGVLFVHWLGNPKTTNHTEFQHDAQVLAAHGAVCLLIDAPWAQKRWFTKIRTPATDFQMSVDVVRDLRRSIDVLQRLGANGSDIAYVGHDFGAMYGAVLSGVDPRPKYYVLMAGTSTFAQWFLLGVKPADTAAYTSQMSLLDPPQYLQRASATAFLLQYAAKDAYINAAQARAFYEAAPDPKLVGFYNSDHSLDVPQAHADRVRWLLDMLTRTSTAEPR